MTYPKTLRENLEYRRELESEEGRQWGVLREVSSRDILLWFNIFGWTLSNFAKYEGRSDLSDYPFVTYDFQDEFILGLKDGIEKGYDIFADKSRDMGVTWLIIGVFVWFWLFSFKRVQFKLGSRKEDYVDKSGDMDTLFEKARYMTDRLPAYLLPLGFDRKKHSTYMKVYNPFSGSALIGEATNRDFARGGRQNAVLFDEFEAWEMADEAYRSASDATPCKIVVGTPKGSGNKFAELSRGSEITHKFHLIWYIHPLKAVTSKEHIEDRVKTGLVYDKVGRYWVQYSKKGDLGGTYVDQFGKIRSEWYDNEQLKRSADDIAENLDCNYLTTGNPVFDTNVIGKKIAESQPFEIIGSLTWKNPPRFNEYGDCINKNKLEVEFSKNNNGLWQIRKEPAAGWRHRYCMSADIAEGLEQGDFNSYSVLDRIDNEVIATTHNKLKVHEAADELAKMGVYYKYCYIAPERNGLGLSVVEQLRRIYPYIYHKDVLTKGYPEKTDKMGWETFENTKRVIIGNLQKLISENGFVDLDEGFWKECLTFVNDDGKLEAQDKSRNGRCYDDRVMDRAILLWITNLLPLPRKEIAKVEHKGFRKQWYQPTHRDSIIGFAVH